MKSISITYFVHGTTIDNEKGIASGWADARLSNLGKKQSKNLRRLIKSKSFDVVFCSDLKRAIDSAKLTFGKEGIKILIDKRLRECNYGTLTRTVLDQPETGKRISKPFPKGESYRDVEKRIRSFLRYLIKFYQGKHIAIVAHQGPQLALDVLIKGKSWRQAIKEDWRLKAPPKWRPGWRYNLNSLN